MCVLLAMLMQMGCLPDAPRPDYRELWSVYGPTPDCINKNRHINYLTSLKDKPVRSGDVVNEIEYNQAIDMYVERMQWYCEQRY